MKSVSIVTPCFNEEENVEEVYRQVKMVFQNMGRYRYEHIFIDNHSTDRTVEILKSLAKDDRNLKIIVNSRNFGHIRSPFHGMLQARGDAVILLVADLQDPPEMIPVFLRAWESGALIVVGVKPAAKESRFIFAVRKFYYSVVTRISNIRLIKNFTGFGLYDRRIMEILRGLDEPYPYFRGLISEVGFDPVEISYTQPVRSKGVTKNNFYTLYDIAMLGITSHSKVPIRIATISGLILSVASLILSFIYILLKLFFWSSFPIGTAPLLIGVFFFSSVQLFFIGLIGEYILSIQTRVAKMPLVIESERVNFDGAPK